MPGIKRGKSNILIDDDYNIVLNPHTGKHIKLEDTVQIGTHTQNGVIKNSLQVALTAANIIAMGTTPVEVVPAPGADKCIIVDNITFKMVTTATAFTGGGVVEFRYTNASGTLVAASIAAAVVTAGAGTSFTNVRGIEASLTGTVNAAIVIRNATAAFAAGTGTAVVNIDYHVV